MKESPTHFEKKMKRTGAWELSDKGLTNKQDLGDFADVVVGIF